MDRGKAGLKFDIHRIRNHYLSQNNLNVKLAHLRIFSQPCESLLQLCIIYIAFSFKRILIVKGCPAAPAGPSGLHKRGLGNDESPTLQD